VAIGWCGAVDSGQVPRCDAQMDTLLNLHDNGNLAHPGFRHVQMLWATNAAIGKPLQGNIMLRSIGSVTILALLMVGCGGGEAGTGNPSPPPVADFSLAISAPAVAADVGSQSDSVTVTVTPMNGFADPVSVELQGLPTGAQAQPASFSITPGGTQSLSFSLGASTPVGTSAIQIVGSSGSLSHSAQLALTANSLVRTYTSADGRLLYLESGNAVDTARIALFLDWGGAIVEVSANGTNFVNSHDTGREVQVSFRSHSDPNWNPTQGGDEYDRGSPVTADSVTADALYIRTQPIQWTPDFYNGGSRQTVAGDMLLEQTVTAVRSSPNTFQVHYKITHLGDDWHDTGPVEFPAVYTNQDYIRFVRYDGQAPWTHGDLTISQFPNLVGARPTGAAVPERWAALVNAQDAGLAVYSPSADPNWVGFVFPDPGAGSPTDNATNYFAAIWNWTITPHIVAEGDVYLIAGDYHAARDIVYTLHNK
jgi:hypothetical protein